MADQEQHNIEVRMEIDELKAGMTKLTEMLQVLIARGEPPQRTVISEISTTAVNPPQVQQPASTWPEFGFPPNYPPPFATTPMASPSVLPVFSAPVFTELQPVEHTAAQATYEDPPFVYHVAGPQSEI